jgi:hypothetical protein
VNEDERFLVSKFDRFQNQTCFRNFPGRDMIPTQLFMVKPNLSSFFNCGHYFQSYSICFKILPQSFSKQNRIPSNKFDSPNPDIFPNMVGKKWIDYDKLSLAFQINYLRYE